MNIILNLSRDVHKKYYIQICEKGDSIANLTQYKYI